jgi:hypothetical protein
VLGAWFVFGVAGCGGAPAPASEPELALAPASAAPSAAPVTEPTATAEAAPAAEPPSEPAAKPVAAPPLKDPNAMREVKYVVTPEGLKIDVAGVRFLASAVAKQIGQGWGAKVSIKAEATDGKEHVLMNPKNGPLAFAAAVFKKGSTEAERIPDSREGEGEVKVGATASTFARDFPAKGGRVLGIGEKLDIEVALWGLGESAEDRRPVKQFFHVKMAVDKGKPKAVVEPPASVK